MLVIRPFNDAITDAMMVSSGIQETLFHSVEHLD